MLLNDLIKNINIDKVVNSRDVKITGIAYNSRHVTEGNLFVCIKGYKTDGHKFLKDAVKKGAKAAIVLKVDHTLDIPQYVVKDSRIALAQLSAVFYDYPSKKLNVIGVTATSGKTTTTYMLNAIFEKHKLKTGLIGSVILKIGEKYSQATLTTPDSLELQQYF